MLKPSTQLPNSYRHINYGQYISNGKLNIMVAQRPGHGNVMRLGENVVAVLMSRYSNLPKAHIGIALQY